MSTTLTPRTIRTTAETLPALHAGDHLNRETFHNRYAAMPTKFRAELVQGVVIVASPASCPHGVSHAWILTWLGTYAISTPGTLAFDNTTTIINDVNEYQPDAQLVILPGYGGQGVRVGKYVEGAPQLIVEVAATSEAYDLFEKFEVYQQAGVQEYVVVLIRERQVRWFAAKDGTFQPLSADAAGVMRSVTFPGLWLDTAALFAELPTTLLATLQAGLAEPAHAEFVGLLERQRQLIESKPA